MIQAIQTAIFAFFVACALIAAMVFVYITLEMLRVWRDWRKTRGD